MRWMMIALLVSLAALLMAAAGMARHIWLHRGRLRSKPPAKTGQVPDSSADRGEKVNAETER